MAHQMASSKWSLRKCQTDFDFVIAGAVKAHLSDRLLNKEPNQFGFGSETLSIFTETPGRSQISIYSGAPEKIGNYRRSLQILRKIMRGQAASVTR